MPHTLTCQHCHTPYEAHRKDQRFCRKTKACFNAAHAHYKASVRQWYREQGEIGKRERAKLASGNKKRICTNCKKRPVADGNHFLCRQCFAPQSSHVEPQATEYDTYRGQPRL